MDEYLIKIVIYDTKLCNSSWSGEKGCTFPTWLDFYGSTYSSSHSVLQLLDVAKYIDTHLPMLRWRARALSCAPFLRYLRQNQNQCKCKNHFDWFCNFCIYCIHPHFKTLNEHDIFVIGYANISKTSLNFDDEISTHLNSTYLFVQFHIKLVRLFLIQLFFLLWEGTS